MRGVCSFVRGYTRAPRGTDTRESTSTIEHVRIHVLTHRRQDFVLGATPVDSNRRSYLIIYGTAWQKAALSSCHFFFHSWSYRRHLRTTRICYTCFSFFNDQLSISLNKNEGKKKERRKSRKSSIRFLQIDRKWVEEYFQPRFWFFFFFFLFLWIFQIACNLSASSTARSNSNTSLKSLCDRRWTANPCASFSVLLRFCRRFRWLRLIIEYRKQQQEADRTRRFSITLTRDASVAIYYTRNQRQNHDHRVKPTVASIAILAPLFSYSLFCSSFLSFSLSLRTQIYIYIYFKTTLYRNLPNNISLRNPQYP